MWSPPGGRGRERGRRGGGREGGGKEDSVQLR